MEFKKYLLEQLRLHPYMEPRDVAKLCYQAACGGEHMLTDPDAAFNYFLKELETVEPRDCPLAENISDELCRIDLGAWKRMRLPAEWLFYMFERSIRGHKEDKELLEKCLREADEFVKRGETEFSLVDWEKYLYLYRSIGMPAVHHSETYREKAKPSYRLVDQIFCPVIPVLQMAHRARENRADKSRPVVIAIDGRAGSGKSTLSRYLRLVIGSMRSCVKTDDFFLPEHMRTPERLATPGGNVHHERFALEVLPHLTKGEPFSYGYYDCFEGGIAGQQQVIPGDWIVVEGSYSLHPAFGDYADLKIFVDVDPETQEERILDRDGEGLAKRFREQWIPMEEAYFDAFGIREKADLVMRYDAF